MNNAAPAIRELQKLADLYARNLLTDIEFSGGFFNILVSCSELEASAACKLLSPACEDIVRRDLAKIRKAGYLYTPFLLGDERTNEQKLADAEELMPRVKQVCEEIHHWFKNK